jgi:hypothetical protein
VSLGERESDVMQETEKSIVSMRIPFGRGYRAAAWVFCKGSLLFCDGVSTLPTLLESGLGS